MWWLASILLNQGWSAEQVATVLGHADTRMVHRVYGHLILDHEQIEKVAFTRRPVDRLKIVPFPRAR